MQVALLGWRPLLPTVCTHLQRPLCLGCGLPELPGLLLLHASPIEPRALMQLLLRGPFCMTQCQAASASPGFSLYPTCDARGAHNSAGLFPAADSGPGGIHPVPCSHTFPSCSVVEGAAHGPKRRPSGHSGQEIQIRNCVLWKCS